MSECPYCLAQILSGEGISVCRACGTVHHAECWTQNKGCCVRTCAEVSRVAEIDLSPETREKLVLSRESVESARAHRQERISNPCMKCGAQVPEGELYCAECEPGRPENQDARNLGPILVMFAIAAIIIGWIVVGSISMNNRSALPPTEMENKSSQR